LDSEAARANEVHRGLSVHQGYLELRIIV
jgi:hypothetical protein